jgi:hypothetical protein
VGVVLYRFTVSCRSQNLCEYEKKGGEGHGLTISRRIGVVGSNRSNPVSSRPALIAVYVRNRACDRTNGVISSKGKKQWWKYI